MPLCVRGSCESAPITEFSPLSFISIRKNAENGVDGRAAICELRALLDEPVRAVCLTGVAVGMGICPALW